MPLKSLLSEQFQNFRLYFGNVESRQTEGRVHRFRVNMKVLKSLMYTLDWIDEGKRFREGYKMFRAVFRRAGVIRESHLNKSLANEYAAEKHMEKQYSLYLKRSSVEHRRLLNSALASFNHVRLDMLEQESLLEAGKIPGEKLPDGLVGFIRAGALRIFDKRENDRSEHAFHDIRRTMKNIKPVLKLTVDHFPDMIPGQSYQNLTNAEKYIGRWHDLQVFEHSIISFHDAYSVGNKDLMGEYRGLMRRLRRDKDLLEGLIIDSVGVTVKELADKDFPV